MIKFKSFVRLLKIIRILMKYFILLGMIFCAESHADCWGDVEARFAVSRYLLLAIAEHESGLNPHAVNHNENGSYDIGLMQINTSWLPVLKPYGIGFEELKNPCINLNVGAWILANNFILYGKNWRAVGAYNAKTEIKRVHYAQQVFIKLKNIADEYGIESR